MAAILDHYTHLIHKLHGLEPPKMQRNDCYQTLQGSTTVPLDYSKPALIEIMHCRHFGDNALSEAMLAYFTEAYMRHPTKIC